MAIEAKRGCGYRKVGGLYLMAGKLAAPCCRLPLELSVCPCCGNGIKQSRGFTWIDAMKMFGGAQPSEQSAQCGTCPMFNPEFMGPKVGLLWIGEKFYKSPSEFAQEGATLGISRRLSAIPREFEAGKTWILFAHPKAIWKTRDMNEQERADYAAGKEVEGLFPRVDQEPLIGYYVPGVFSAVKPTHFELIVKQSDLDAVRQELSMHDSATDLGTVKLSDLAAKYLKDAKRGVRWIPVPDDDPDHKGSVHDKPEDDDATEPSAADLDLFKGTGTMSRLQPGMPS